MPRYNKPKKRKICITLTEPEIKMAEELLANGVGDSYSTCIGQSIRVAHKDEFPRYKDKRVGIGDSNSSSEVDIYEKAELMEKQKLARKELSVKLLADKREKICTEGLCGRIDGVNCEYTVYRAYPNEIRIENDREVTPLEGLENLDQNLQEQKTLTELAQAVFVGGFDRPNRARNFLANIENGNLKKGQYPEALVEYAKRVVEEAK